AAAKEILLDHVRDDFGVRLGGKAVALLGELLLQGNIVFNNAVMNDNNFPSAVAMWVGVLFGRAAMCGPAGVANSIGAIEWLEGDDFFKISQLAFGAPNLQAITVSADGNAGGVIAAILKPSESI